MARPRKKRQPTVAISEGKFGVGPREGEPTGKWHAFVPIRDAKGNPVLDRRRKPKRKHIEKGSYDECCDAALAFEDEQAEMILRYQANMAPKVKEPWRAHAWLRYWLYDIKWPAVSHNAWKDYRATIEGDVIPNLDDDELPAIQFSGYEKMIGNIKRRHPGRTDKPNRAYRYVRMALDAAVARATETGLWANPIRAVPLPKHRSPVVDPPTVDEVKLLLIAARTRRNYARWTVGSALGLRPGEALALMRDDFWIVDLETKEVIPEDEWDNVDLNAVAGMLRIKENLYRREWQHGCGDPHGCGWQPTKRHPHGIHRKPRKACPGKGAHHDRYHLRGQGCPKADPGCPPGCVKHARSCPQANGGIGPDGQPLPAGRLRKPPKSDAGVRTIVLHQGMTAELISHCREQDKERASEGEFWVATGALFATKDGRLIQEHDDWEESRKILTEAGLPDSRPYDWRHAAATMLLLKGVHKRLVMDALGWSSEAMLKRYQHILDEMRGEVANAIGELLYGSATDLATDPPPANVFELDEWRRKAA